MNLIKLLLRGLLSLFFTLLLLGSPVTGVHALEIPQCPETGAVSAGMHYTAYLTPEGTVRSTMSSHAIQDWTNIVAIDAGPYHIVGLRSDGTVVTTDTDVDLSGWKNIVKVSAGDSFYVGLKKDGTVVAKGVNSDGQCKVSKWKNIVDISAGLDHTVAVREDGTVVAAGKNDTGECTVTDWENIVQISTLQWYTIGLKSDGTVVVAGGPDNDFQYGPQGELGWTDIISVSAGYDSVYGLHQYDDVLVYRTQYTISTINPQQSLDWGMDREINSMDAGFYHLACMGYYGELYFTGGGHNGETDACRLLAEKGNHKFDLNDDGKYVCIVCGYHLAAQSTDDYCDHYSFSNINVDDPALVTVICNKCGYAEEHTVRDYFSDKLFSRLLSNYEEYPTTQDVVVSFFGNYHPARNFKGVEEFGVQLFPEPMSVACFDVSENASYFSGRIITGSNCGEDVNMSLTIYADDNFLMCLNNLDFETEIALELNLCDVDTLRFECSAYSFGHLILTGSLFP